jgi:hypothetical protein
MVSYTSEKGEVYKLEENFTDGDTVVLCDIGGKTAWRIS